MPVVTPLLYDAAARESANPDFPPLRADAIAGLRDRVGSAGEDLPRVSEGRPGLARFIRPVAFARSVENGIIGVPLLERDQMDVFVADARQGTASTPRGRRWWELWETETGSWALFPGDARPDPRIAVVLPVVLEAATQLRPLDLGGPTEDSPDQPAARPEPCALDLEVQEPGRSYRGTCHDHGCSHACEKDLWLIADTGVTELIGCDCPAAKSTLRWQLVDPIAHRTRTGMRAR
jgi:hypothetical protein